MSETPAQRRLHARKAAHHLHAQGRTNTRAAVEALQKRFEDEVDPDRILSLDERAKRVRHARAAFYTDLQIKSSKARSKP